MDTGISVEIQKAENEEGMSTVILPDKLALKFQIERKMSLIGKFMSARQILENIRRWMKANWMIKGDLEMATAPCDFLLFQFNQEEDLVWVLQNGP